MIFNKKEWCVYKHTNIINNKSYIGITSQKPIYRWGHEGHNYLGQIKFYRAIQKYGWDNFLHEILFTGLSKGEALKKESELINKYDCIRNGYNSPCKQTEELYSKEIYCVETGEIFPSIASAARKYDKSSTTLSHHLHGDDGFKTAYSMHWYFMDDELNEAHYLADYLYEEHQLEKKNLEQKIINLYQSDKKTIREISDLLKVSRKKISDILKNNQISLKARVIDAIALDKNTLQPIISFNSLKEACEWCGLNGNTATQRIHNAIIDSWRICKGYKWTTTNEKLLEERKKREEIFTKNNLPVDIFFEEYQNGRTVQEISNSYQLSMPTVSKALKNIGVKLSEGGKKRIIQVDIATNKKIKTYESIKEVYKDLKMNSNNRTLSKRCKDHKEYHGYIWYFEEDYLNLDI